MSRSVRAVVPVRVADVGGWTDTWFGSPGRVCHVAVGPGVTVEASLTEVDRRVDPVQVDAPALGPPFRVGPHPDPVTRWRSPLPGRHPLVEHAIAAILDEVDLDEGVGVDLRVTSAVPPSASLGTSASVVVALLAALDALTDDGRLAADGAAAVAELAHRVETVRAGREAGVQDHWAAAFGGAELVTINPYPDVTRTPVELDDATVAALDERLVTVVFAPHDSSTEHGHVITDMVTCSSTGHDRARAALRDLSALAGDAAAALGAGDLDRWGATLTAATEAQRRLRAGLVGAAHDRAAAIAADHEALGWKVNGAGGEGGSLTVLATDGPSAAALASDLVAEDGSWQVLDLSVAGAGCEVTANLG